MPEEELKKMTKPNEAQQKILESVHKTLLEALRHREQEILRYIAILAPALGGFVLLLRNFIKDGYPFVFAIGTVGVLFLLLLGAVYSLVLGAVYSLALGFNFRDITLQLAKLDSDPCLDIAQYMLNGWPRSAEIFVDKYKFLGIPYCTPPEIIKVFWWAFIGAIVGVTISVFFLTSKENADVSITKVRCVLMVWGAICFTIAVLWSIYYGYKLKGHADKEPPKWVKEKPSC
jgi:hypothetical protein